MSHPSQQLLNDAMELAPADRGRLAALLIESLEAEADPVANEEWSEEIQRRLADMDAGRATLIPWSEARLRIRGEDGAGAR